MTRQAVHRLWILSLSIRVVLFFAIPGSAFANGAGEAIAMVAGPTVSVSPTELIEEPSSTVLKFDLDGLKTRLRATDAIGFFAKCKLKGRLDDLVDRLAAFHQHGRGETLLDLHHDYDVLIGKIISMLIEEDPNLAADIESSQRRIWELLEDPDDFAIAAAA